jgi:predicted DNA-binding antitoxin AbrB/MazE fold protein
MEHNKVTIRLEIAGIEKLISLIEGKNRKIETFMATIEERLAAIRANLEEAKTEILAKIETLKAESLSTEGEAALSDIETAATGLANIANPEEPPAP